MLVNYASRYNNVARIIRVSLVAQTVKNPPVIQETWVQSLGREDPMQKGMSTQSSILVWRIPWTEEPRGLQSMGTQSVGHDLPTERKHTHTFNKLKKTYA